LLDRQTTVADRPATNDSSSFEPELVRRASSVARLAELAELLAVAAEIAIEELGADLEAAARCWILIQLPDALLCARRG
jgi:hypothetical protein